MSFAITPTATSAIQVGDAVLSFVRGNGEGRSYASQVGSPPDSSRLPAIIRVDVVQVDSQTYDLDGTGETDTSGYDGTNPAGPVSGDIDTFTAPGSIGTPVGPVRVHMVVDPADGYNSPTYVSELLDANSTVMVATGTG